MLRRLHTPGLRVGSLKLDADEAHHARDVLRLGVGEAVELFDDAGAVARGVIEQCDAREVIVRVEQIEPPQSSSGIIVAAAVPKGDRADWMIEKLSELGVERFIPLATARSVVLPAGKNKRQRWQRLSIESAKQSRRAGVMQIEDLTRLAELLYPVENAPRGSLWCYLSTSKSAPVLKYLQSQIANRNSQITLVIGPEGGWTSEEMELMESHRLTGVRLTGTILRVETAAVAAAAVVAIWKAT